METKAMIEQEKPRCRKPRPQDLELDSIHVEPADNGYMVTVSKRVKRNLRDMNYNWPAPERSVFTDMHEMLAHIGSKFGVKVKGRPQAESESE
jgi:hypothetical protein